MIMMTMTMVVLAAADELLKKKNKILSVHHFHCYALSLHENICGRRADDDDDDEMM